MTTALTDGQQKALDEFGQFPVWGQAREIPVDVLEFCSWNVNEMTDSEFSELVCEIEEGGFDEPVGIIPLDGAPGRYLVPSGEHRVRAAIALEMAAIPCVLKVHLTEAEEADVVMWSVKRNNIRGRVNEQKYRALEQSLSDKHNVRVEAARQRMLIKGDLAKTLAKAEKPQRPKPETPHEPDDTPPVPGARRGGPETDGQRDQAKTDRKRSGLERSFKSVWEQTLMDNADSVEHGYLCFAENGKLHLTVECSDRLIGLVKGVVEQAKNESAAIDELLCDAISNELKAQRS